jgi:hypothetical protein
MVVRVHVESKSINLCAINWQPNCLPDRPGTVTPAEAEPNNAQWRGAQGVVSHRNATLWDEHDA